MLNWVDDARFVVRETFRVIPNAASGQRFAHARRPRTRRGSWSSPSRGGAWSATPRSSSGSNPGASWNWHYQGGSTALFAEIARPERLVAIDKQVDGHKPLDDYIARLGLGDVLHVHDGVDQADTRAVSEITEQEFPGESLDLVVDDCSHLYALARLFQCCSPAFEPAGST